MPRLNGQLLVCDRCGASAFAKALAPKELDGGFTKIDQYDKIEGWESASGLYKLLCPACNKKWKSMMDRFMSCTEEGDHT